MTPEKAWALLLILMVVLCVFKEEHRAWRIRKSNKDDENDKDC
jgi:hypothetical protein